MSKVNEKALNLFKRNESSNEFQEAFEVREASSTQDFIEKFLASPLSREEDSAIQNILWNEYRLEIEDEQVGVDYKNLLELTTQIRAIERQSVLLHGERVFKARNVLKKYRKGAFTQWLIVAYGNRQTPYSFLQYYEFFKALDDETQKMVQEMPKKAAYILARRRGGHEKKVEIIKKHYNSKPGEIIQIVQDIFPKNDGKIRMKVKNDDVILNSISSNLHILFKKKKDLNGLSAATLSELENCRDLLDKILSSEEQDASNSALEALR
jgi:hypothetical protein